MNKERILKDIDMLLGHLRYLVSLEPLIQYQMEKGKKVAKKDKKKDEAANGAT